MVLGVDGERDGRGRVPVIDRPAKQANTSLEPILTTKRGSGEDERRVRGAVSIPARSARFVRHGSSGGRPLVRLHEVDARLEGLIVGLLRVPVPLKFRAQRSTTVLWEEKRMGTHLDAVKTTRSPSAGFFQSRNDVPKKRTYTQSPPFLHLSPR